MYAILRPSGEYDWKRSRQGELVTWIFSPTPASVGTITISPWKSTAM
jgi:hypothetical protein